MNKHQQARLIREFEAYALVADHMSAYDRTDTEALGEIGNKLFDRAETLGWDWENDANFTAACIKATLAEIYTEAARILKGAHIPKGGTCDHCGTQF